MITRPNAAAFLLLPFVLFVAPSSDAAPTDGLAPPPVPGTKLQIVANFASTPEPAVALDENNKLTWFIRGSDDKIWNRKQTSAGAWTWEYLGSGFNSAPAVVSAAYSGLNLFARGAGNAVYYSNKPPAGAWSGFQSIGGTCTSAPAATLLEFGTVLWVFCKGADNAVWYTRGLQGKWDAWKPIPGGTVTSAPAVVGQPGGGISYWLTVFAKGPNGTLLQVSSNDAGGTWSAWGPISGAGGPLASKTFSSGPAATLTPSEGIFVFARGTDNALYYSPYYQGPARSWHSAAGELTSGPGVAVVNGKITALVRGPNNAYSTRAGLSSTFEKGAWIPAP